MTTATQYVWIQPATEFRWLWAPLAEAIYCELGLKPLFICTTSEDAEYYKSQYKGANGLVTAVMPDRYEMARTKIGLVESKSAIDIVKEFEEQKTTLFFRDLYLPDRQFARSFVTGADKVARSRATDFATHDVILRAGATILKFVDDLSDKYPPVLLLCLSGGTGMVGRPIMEGVRRAGGMIRNLVHSRFGYRYFWAVDERHNAPELINSFVQIKAPSVKDIERVAKEMSPTGDFEFYVSRMRKKRRLLPLAKELARNSYKHLKNHVARNRKAKIGYSMLGEWQMIINGRMQGNFLTSEECVRLADIDAEFKKVMFPLQVEPELSLHGLAPRYTDQLNTVRQIAMNLPANAILLVKEHPAQVGRRGPQFYKSLKNIQNVRLISDLEHSYSVIRASDLIIAVTSSVAHEAAVMGKKVIYLADDGPLHCVAHVRKIGELGGIEHLSRAFDEEIWEVEEERVIEGARYYMLLERVGLDLGFLGAGMFSKNFNPSQDDMTVISRSLINSIEKKNRVI